VREEEDEENERSCGRGEGPGTMWITIVRGCEI
jgi:hypothetical protein